MTPNPNRRQTLICFLSTVLPHPTPVLLPGKSHGQRSLVGCSPWGRKESDTTERLHFHFSLSCIGEGNGNPFQYSCLENPRDGGAWWAAVYGVAQSRTRLKRFSSSSSIHGMIQHVLFGFWLPLSMFLRFIHVAPWTKVPSFLLLNSIPLFSAFGYYKWSCSELSFTNLCVDMCFHFFWLNTYEWNS